MFWWDNQSNVSFEDEIIKAKKRKNQNGKLNMVELMTSKLSLNSKINQQFSNLKHFFNGRARKKQIS